MLYRSTGHHVIATETKLRGTVNSIMTQAEAGQ